MLDAVDPDSIPHGGYFLVFELLTTAKKGQNVEKQVDEVEVQSHRGQNSIVGTEQAHREMSCRSLSLSLCPLGLFLVSLCLCHHVSDGKGNTCR